MLVVRVRRPVEWLVDGGDFLAEISNMPVAGHADTNEYDLT